MTAYPVITFEQFQSGTGKDALILFAAPAKAIASWAGIPRKGWNIRMLYQRWITPSREQEVTDFWRVASTKSGKDDEFILGPTALTIAIRQPPVLENNAIGLEYHSPLQMSVVPNRDGGNR